jgi:hypothetical protein
MLTYNFLVTIYLTVVGIGGEFVGVLLWPAAALHAALTALLAYPLIKTRSCWSLTKHHSRFGPFWVISGHTDKSAQLRFAPDSRHSSVRVACPKSAKTGSALRHSCPRATAE